MNLLGELYSLGLVFVMIGTVSYLIVKSAQVGINALRKRRKNNVTST